MRDTPEKGKDMEEKQKEEEKVVNDAETKIENKKEPDESEEEVSEKIINIDALTDDIQALNIKPECEEETFAVRGPDGGKPSMYPSHCVEKNLPMPPMPNNFIGQNYNVYHPQTQKQTRRMADESSGQPLKYTRPQPDGNQQSYAPVHQLSQFGMQSNFGNNLSQPTHSYGNPPQAFNFGGPVTTTTPMTQLRFTGTTSGGLVKFPSPVTNMQSPFGSGDGNIVDGLLEGLNIPDGNERYYNIEPGFTNDTYSSKTVRESRRCSDPDSGVESAEERSPYSAQTPSPASSVYTSPPSVDSACGRSPNYEPFPSDKGFVQNALSSPKYQGMQQSPASYRTTPSPASTSGYGSPIGPQLEDEIFDDNQISELADILNVIGDDLNNYKTEDKNLQKSIVSQQMEITQMKLQKQSVGHMNDLHMVHRQQPNGPIPTQRNMVPNMVPPHRLQTDFLPQTGVSTVCTIGRQQAMTTVGGQQAMTAVGGQQAMTTVGGHQAMTTVGGQQTQIILFPPTNTTQPIVVIPVSTPQQQRKPDKKQLRKILPKISAAPASSTNTTRSCTAMTSTCSANKTDVTMTTKEAPATTGKNSPQSQAQCPKMDRLLMIARRTVADIPREDLRKCDDEGDTYLHIAVCRTDRHMVQALLERLHREGLDSLVDQENHKRQTPLYLAVYINQPVMVNMFIRFRANVNVLAQNLSADGSTTEVKAAIHVAAAHGDDYLRTLCQLLEAKDLSINIVNNYGQTALHCAILAHMKAKRNSPDRINSIDNIKALLSKGADPTAQDKKSGKTPLMYAIEQKNLELVETILSQVEPDKVKNVVKTQAFDGSSCLKIAEGLKDSYNVQIWNKLWNSLQSAVSGSSQYQIPVHQIY